MAAAQGTPARPQARRRAAKALPTDRIKMDRQYEILAALGRLSSARNPMNADSLARTVGGGIAPTTVMLSNNFFADAGWITNPAKGQYAATDALVRYARRLDTDTPERAALELHEPVRRSWFWQVLDDTSSTARSASATPRTCSWTPQRPAPATCP